MHYINEAENIRRVSGFETNKIRQVTEGVCLKEPGRTGKGVQTNKPTK